MPTEYCTVVAWIRARQTDSTNIHMDLQLRPDASMVDDAGNYFLTADNLHGFSGSNEDFAEMVTWVPPPVIMVASDSPADGLPSVGLHKTNVNTMDIRLNLEAYLYDRRAYESGHAGDMLALVGRGGSRFYSAD